MVELLLIAIALTYRRGYSDQEIEAAFAKYDLDGDRVLNEEEQKKMQDDLEGQRVGTVCCSSGRGQDHSAAAKDPPFSSREEHPEFLVNNM